jgi:hypothetical protein
MNKLTDDQLDLIMAMLDDLDNNKYNIDDTIGIKTLLTKVYNKSYYDEADKMVLNSIRDFWMEHIYKKGESSWDYLRQSPV